MVRTDRAIRVWRQTIAARLTDIHSFKRSANTGHTHCRRIRLQYRISFLRISRLLRKPARRSPRFGLFYPSRKRIGGWKITKRKRDDGGDRIADEGHQRSVLRNTSVAAPACGSHRE